MSASLLLHSAAVALTSGGGYDCTNFDLYVWSRIDFQVCVDGEIDNFQSLAWAFGSSVLLTTGDCYFCDETISIDYDVGIGAAEANTAVCPDYLIAFGGGSSAVSVSGSCIIGHVAAGGASSGESGEDCYPCGPGSFLGLGGGGAGVDCTFDIIETAAVSLSLSTPPTFATGTERGVALSFLRFDDGTFLYSALVEGGNGNRTTPSVTTGQIQAGSRTMQSASVTVLDVRDDLTNDGRFNQDDVDFLAGLVGTPSATDPAYARFDLINDSSTSADDGIQASEVAIFQQFIESGLSSGYLGDADSDGFIGCNDITLALAQPFSGESFPAAAYNVHLDADLDGDNDAADRSAVAIALLVAEPANFNFDGVINFFDQSEFMSLYNAQDPLADLAAPYGTYNFFDVQAFLDYANNPECF